VRDSELPRDVAYGADCARVDAELHVVVVARAEEVPRQGSVRNLDRDKPGQWELGIGHDIEDTKLVVWELDEDSIVSVVAKRVPVGSRGSAST